MTDRTMVVRLAICCVFGLALLTTVATGQSPSPAKPELKKGLSLGKLKVKDPIIEVPNPIDSSCYYDPPCPPATENKTGSNKKDVDAKRNIILPFAALSASATACDDQDAVPPQQARMEVRNFKATKRFEQCAQAAVAFRSKRLIDGRYTARTMAIAATESQLREYRGIVEQYRNKCYVPQDSIRSLDQRLKTAIDANIGFFIAEGSAYPWCSGVMIGNSVVTARHCFASDLARPSAIKIPAQMRFALFSEPTKRMRVKLNVSTAEPPLRFEPDDPRSDWLVLSVGDSTGQNDSSVRIGQPRRWERLYVAGLDTERLLVRRLDRSLGELGREPLAGLFEPRLEFGPLCRAGFVEDGVIFHSCATELGMSGSPVFQVGTDGTPELVGIHLGGSGRLESFCARQHEKALPNFAIALPEAARLAVQRQSGGR